MKSFSISFVLISLAFFAIFECNANANGLSYDYYRRSCPNVEKIVKRIIRQKTRTNPADLGAKLIRMQFHDCFVRGCDASVLLDTVNNNSRAEKEAIPNRSLSGFDVIEDIKSAIEIACPRTVSCADILALASREAVSLTVPFKLFRRGRNQSPIWNVPLGRKDGRVSLATEINGNIPGPAANFSSLVQIFNKKGLNVDDLVVLSGAHTIGVGHCGGFSRRLYNFTGKGDADPTLDRKYANLLRKKCPNPANPNTTVEMDPRSSRSFDNNYYKILVQNKGLFQSDAALITDGNSTELVNELGSSPMQFFIKFATSMEKMIQIEVITKGEVRKKCSAIN